VVAVTSAPERARVRQAGSDARAVKNDRRCESTVTTSRVWLAPVSEIQGCESSAERSVSTSYMVTYRLVLRGVAGTCDLRFRGSKTCKIRKTLVA
jgi:hypothetical protein